MPHRSESVAGRAASRLWPWRRDAESSRLAALKRVSTTGATAALRHYLSTPLPHPRTPVGDLRLLAIDMETTGLDPDRDRWLSVGWVPLDGPEIVLAGAGGSLLRQSTQVQSAQVQSTQLAPPHRTPQNSPDEGVGQSATVHGLTDDQIAAGRPLTEVVDRVLDALAGRVLLAHYTRIEIGQLTRAVKRLHGIDLPVTSVDTLELHFAIWGGEQARIPDGALRLWAARDQYGLPEYPAHEAFIDALACAELFLAQLQDAHFTRPGLTLADLQT